MASSSTIKPAEFYNNLLENPVHQVGKQDGTPLPYIAGTTPEDKDIFTMANINLSEYNDSFDKYFPKLNMLSDYFRGITHKVRTSDTRTLLTDSIFHKILNDEVPDFGSYTTEAEITAEGLRQATPDMYAFLEKFYGTILKSETITLDFHNEENIKKINKIFCTVYKRIKDIYPESTEYAVLDASGLINSVDSEMLSGSDDEALEDNAHDDNLHVYTYACI